MLMKNKPLLLTLLSSLISPLAVASTFTDSEDGRFDMGHYIAENATGFLPVPIIITEPAVGYGGGLVGLFLHESEEEKKARQQAALMSVDGGARLVPAAMTVVGAAGTENGSWFAFAGHRHSWFKDALRYTGGAGLGQVNLDVYRELPIIDLGLKIGTENSGIAALQHLQFRVASTPLMLGVKQVWTKTDVSLDVGNEWLNDVLERIGDSGKFPGLGETTNSALGLTVEYDTRDNIFYPTEGYILNAEYMVYDRKLGGDYDYQVFGFDGQGYIPLADKWNLALAGNYQQFESDDLLVPLTSKPYVDMRGVPSFRYQGDKIQTLQSQVTYDIDNRWNVSAFYGYGQALNSSSDDQSVQAYGAGFRYKIARRYGLRMGVDLAISEGEVTSYINVGTGF
ncbi:BamA/TamA family outer membrane protein [Vibrio astriarenae]|uniref:BamA/TamA family outer membrane protein n=1 Tax=Vibrio astriarenae TaxID=1481923 RepID=UPI003736D03E